MAWKFKILIGFSCLMRLFCTAKNYIVAFSNFKICIMIGLLFLLSRTLIEVMVHLVHGVLTSSLPHGLLNGPPKGSSIYDVHKKIRFLISLPPVHMRPHGPDPPPPCGRPHAVDMKYRSLEMASTTTFLKLKFDYMILIYLNCTISNLYH